MHILGEDTEYSPRKTSKYMNKMTWHVNLCYKRNREGTKVKNENGGPRELGQASVGGRLKPERIEELQCGKWGEEHSIQRRDLTLKP